MQITARFGFVGLKLALIELLNRPVMPNTETRSVLRLLALGFRTITKRKPTASELQSVHVRALIIAMIENRRLLRYFGFGQTKILLSKTAGTSASIDPHNGMLTISVPVSGPINHTLLVHYLIQVIANEILAISQVPLSIYSEARSQAGAATPAGTANLPILPVSDLNEAQIYLARLLVDDIPINSLDDKRLNFLYSVLLELEILGSSRTRLVI